jgi:hypothetical protein
MTDESKRYIYKAEEIFEDIPDDPKNVNMKIPDEIAKEVGLEPGDTVRVLWGDQGTVVIEKVEKETNVKG